MTTTRTRTFIAVAALATLGFGCGGSDKAPAAETTARTEMQPPVEVASSAEKAPTERAHGDEHHGEKMKKEIDPSTPIGQGQLMLEEGKLEEAAAQFKSITEAEPDNAKAWQLYGYALHAAGKLDEALPVHQKAAEFEKTAPVAHYNIACVYALQGDVDAAYAALDQAVAAGFSGAEHIAKDPDLKSLRSDARWQGFEAKVQANYDEHKAEWEAKKAKKEAM